MGRARRPVRRQAKQAGTQRRREYLLVPSSRARYSYMGQRGPASSAPGGYGTVSSKGYRRVWDTRQLRYRMEHVVVWEAANGTVPDRHQVHHRDHDKLNNDLANLQLVNAVDHKRIHSGCQLRDGQWWKPCGVCGEFKPVGPEHWYLSVEGWPLYGRCRPCHIARAVRDRQLRRMR